MKLINRKNGAKLAGISFRVFWNYVNRGIIPQHCHLGGLRGREQLWRVSDIEDSADRIKEYQEDNKRKSRLSLKSQKVCTESTSLFDCFMKTSANIRSR